MAADLEMVPVAGGVRFRVHVQPRASKNEISGIYDHALKIRLAAPPVEGAANRALAAFLADVLHVKPHQVSLVRGSDSRLKVVEVSGLSAEDVQRRCREAIAGGQV